MAGLELAIHPSKELLRRLMDARVTPAYDDGERGDSAAP
jgi:hypothetical protein